MSLSKAIGGFAAYITSEMWKDIVKDLGPLIDTARQCSYEGFEPKQFLVWLQKVYQGNAKAEKKELARDFLMDIKRVIGLYCAVGTKMTAKRISHTGEEGIRIYEHLRNIFQIEDTPRDALTVTIQRIVACFPHVVARAYASPQGEYFRIPGGMNTDLPRALHFSMAPSVIPISDEWKNVRSQYFKWAIEFDKVINGEKSDAAVLFGYYTIQKNSNLIAEADRKKLMIDLAIDPAAVPEPEAEPGSDLDRFVKGTLKVKSVQIASGSGSGGKGARGAVQPKFN